MEEFGVNAIIRAFFGSGRHAAATHTEAAAAAATSNTVLTGRRRTVRVGAGD